MPPLPPPPRPPSSESPDGRPRFSGGTVFGWVQVGRGCGGSCCLQGAAVPLLAAVQGGEEEDGGGAGVQQLLGIKATCGVNSCLVVQGQLGR